MEFTELGDQEYEVPVGNQFIVKVANSHESRLFVLSIPL